MSVSEKGASVSILNFPGIWTVNARPLTLHEISFSELSLNFTFLPLSPSEILDATYAAF